MHNEILDTVLVSRKEGEHHNQNHPEAAMSGSGSTANPADEEAKCPVDHKTRETWVRQARAVPAAPTTTTTMTTHERDASAAPAPHGSQQPTNTSTTTSSWSWSKSWTGSWTGGWSIPFSSSGSSSSSSSSSSTASPDAKQDNAPGLGTSRVVSSIPRSSSPGPSSCPVNHEQETGASASGNWIYPSEKMFFDAMKRKGYDAARAADMQTVVPIHNAVNERAWAEILRWEQPYVAPRNAACGGPRLHSFAGLSESMSPKARLNTILGYTAPFDRHDWVVDRCGTKVEYVIDFYAGRPGANGGGGGKLNFYLDVRPKLNTWEGVKMRVTRGLGLV